LAVLLSVGSARAADIAATPADYRSKLTTLAPGDNLRLAAGDYADGLPISGLNGTAAAPITIAGPAAEVARLLGNASRNTIDIRNSSYITIENLTIDGQDIAGIDAIKASGTAVDWAHHITIENCIILRHDGGATSQQTVGISTKVVAWDWVVRHNLIDGAGTGIYFGNSDGTRAFIGGLIEYNVFRRTLGYNMQIKHQLARESVPGVPTEERVTVIRHNVFIKDSSLPSPDGVRPNLLVDGFPDSGPGSLDHYEVYGNFFFHNDAEALVQATGRVHVHDNVFVDSLQPALRMVNHEGKTVIDALVYNNTIYDTASGIVFSNAPSGTSLVAGNAIFSATPLSGTMTDEHDNVSAPVANAASYVVFPSEVLGEMDFFPISGSALHGAVVDISKAVSDMDHDRDFNGTSKDFTYRGAYQGEGQNPGFLLDDTFKPMTGGGAGGSTGAGGSSGSAGGGSAGASGTSSGGSATSGGGGVSGSGAAGSGALGGTGASTGGASGTQAAGDGEDSGCACASAARGSGRGVVGVGLLMALLLRRSKRPAIRTRTSAD
jgi:hypothetical protein